jgi:hypothetical protein
MVPKKKKTFSMDGYYPDDRQATIDLYSKGYREVQKFYSEIAKLDKKKNKGEEINELVYIEKMIDFIKPSIVGGKIWNPENSTEVDFKPSMLEHLEITDIKQIVQVVAGTLEKKD